MGQFSTTSVTSYISINKYLGYWLKCHCSDRVLVWFLKSFKINLDAELQDTKQVVQTARKETSAKRATVQPETQAEPVTTATAAEPTHTISIPVPPVEDVRNKKGNKNLKYSRETALCFVLFRKVVIYKNQETTESCQIVTIHCTHLHIAFIHYSCNILVLFLMLPWMTLNDCKWIFKVTKTVY